MAGPALQKAAFYVTMSCRSARHLHPVFSAAHSEALEIPTYPALAHFLRTCLRRLDVPTQTLRSCCTRRRRVRRSRRHLVARTCCSASRARNTREPKDLEFAGCPTFTLQYRVDRHYTLKNCMTKAPASLSRDNQRLVSEQIDSN